MVLVSDVTRAPKQPSSSDVLRGLKQIEGDENPTDQLQTLHKKLETSPRLHPLPLHVRTKPTFLAL